MPIVQLFRKHALLVLIAALVFAGNNAVGYMTTGGYIQGYATNPEGPLGLDRGPVLWAVAGSAVTWLLIDAARRLASSDRIGRRSDLHHRLDPPARRRVPAVPAGEHRQHLACCSWARDPHDRPRLHLRTAGGAVHRAVPGQSSASPASRSRTPSARSLGGAFAPTIATALVQATGSTECGHVVPRRHDDVIGLLATLLLRDRSGIPLGPDHEAEQAVSPIYGMSRRPEAGARAPRGRLPG